jgi:hypothetical protein
METKAGLVTVIVIFPPLGPQNAVNHMRERPVRLFSIMDVFIGASFHQRSKYKGMMKKKSPFGSGPKGLK